MMVMDAFSLKELSPFKVERTEDWGNDPDSSYSEMIRVRGSKTEPPDFMVPSHLYKYSETELGIYLKDHKNLWRALGKLLNEEIDIHEAELMIHFPISMFSKVAQIVPFVRKRGSKKFSLEASAKRDAMNAKRHTDKMRQNDKISDFRGSNGIIALDSFLKIKKAPGVRPGAGSDEHAQPAKTESDLNDKHNSF